MNIQQQLIREHASLIVEVVQAFSDNQLKQKLLDDLNVAEQNGWGNLVGAIRHILNGVLDIDALGNLDPEDEVIALAMIQGIEDPSSLPSNDANHNPLLAPTGLAGIISEAAQGEENALHMLAMMDKDLNASGDSDLMAFAQILRRLLNGERNTDSLIFGLHERSAALISSTIDELNSQE